MRMKFFPELACKKMDEDEIFPEFDGKMMMVDGEEEEGEEYNEVKWENDHRKEYTWGLEDKYYGGKIILYD